MSNSSIHSNKLPSPMAEPTQKKAAPPLLKQTYERASEAYAEVAQADYNAAMGMDQIDWGGEPGKCYEFWKINPCCQAPNPAGMACCCANWCCFSSCATAKLFASSVNQECAIIPHLCCACYCSTLTWTMIRYNLRRKHGAKGNFFGDYMCSCCCGWCSMCQILRSVTPDAWNIFTNYKEPRVANPELMFLV